MDETGQLIKLLEKKEKLVALLAPSFPIMYSYPQIIGKLKRLGFSFVVEVAAGAQKTNEAVYRALQENPKSRFITNPCPTITRLIKNKFPSLEKFLLTVDPPMIATARLVNASYPGLRPVFIGPCITKKIEASVDYPELNILVLTFKELNTVLGQLKFTDQDSDKTAQFDLGWSPTRLYPLSGGLVQSCGVGKILAQDQIAEISGPKNCEEALRAFEKNEAIRLLDILYCDGGCVGGPGIDSHLPLDDRRQKVVNFWHQFS